MNVCIIGATPNEWVAASELSRAGHQVTLVACGGQGLRFEEFHPGYRAWSGVDSVRVDPALLGGATSPVHAGRTALRADGSWTRVTPRQVEGVVSPADAAAWHRFRALMDEASSVLRAALREPAEAVGRWRALPARTAMETLRLPWTPIRDLLDEYFEDPVLKGLLASSALRGVRQGPLAAGTAALLLNRWARGEAFGGSLPPAASLPEGVHVLSGAPSGAVEVLADRVVALTLEDGTRVEADQFLSGLDLRQTFRGWLRPPQLETEWNQQVRRFRFGGCVARLLLAVEGRPRLSCPPELLSDTLVLEPDLLGLERCLDATKPGRPAAEPWVELTVPSLLAPDGDRHVVSCWIQYAGADSLEQAALARLRRFWPDLDAQVVGRCYRGPAELERDLGVTEGHLFGGEATLDQLGPLRPGGGFSGMAMPFSNLDLCGPGSGPGGHDGWAGWQAAQRLLARV